MIRIAHFLVDEFGDLLHLNCLTVKIEDVRPFLGAVSTSDERSGGVGNVLKISSSAKTNVKRPTQHRRFHGFRRIAGKAGISVYSVNSQRPQPNAREAVIEEVDASITLIGPFEDAIVRSWLAG